MLYLEIKDISENDRQSILKKLERKEKEINDQLFKLLIKKVQIDNEIKAFKNI